MEEEQGTAEGPSAAAMPALHLLAFSPCPLIPGEALKGVTPKTGTRPHRGRWTTLFSCAAQSHTNDKHLSSHRRHLRVTLRNTGPVSLPGLATITSPLRVSEVE